MVKVYAVVLVLGVVALLAWIVGRALAVNVDRPAIDPEERFGTSGRRVVAAMVGFGMGGMSAEFSPLDLTWPVALLLALMAGSGLAWYAGWIDRNAEPETT